MLVKDQTLIYLFQAAERRQSAEDRAQTEQEIVCLSSINDLSIDELKKTEKFSDRSLSTIAEKRPFSSFSALTECLSAIPRGASQLQLYLDYLENRSILDRVLDACRKRAKQIQAELERMQAAESGEVVTAGLNPDCKLHPYQRVGLQWLVMMSRLGLDAILADEMGLGECGAFFKIHRFSKNHGFSKTTKQSIQARPFK